MDEQMIPVYFINGFLESGKTEFINYTIEEDYFKIDELTLTHHHHSKSMAYSRVHSWCTFCFDRGMIKGIHHCMSQRIVSLA